MVTRTDYGSDEVRAARSVIIELVHLLGEYRDKIVLIGGWIPGILLPSGSRPHIGSIDVDIALDHRRIHEDAYRTILELLLARGYRQGKQPFIFLRDVELSGRIITVQVDLLAGEYEGTGKSHRHQRVQAVQARKARGCDLAFQFTREVVIEGELPNGAHDRVSVYVASIVPFMVMKGMAIEERLKEKDAWDVYYCLLNFPGGVRAMIEEFRPHLGNKLIQEGLRKLAAKFASTEHLGPQFVADFEEIGDLDERAQIQRDAFERVKAFLTGLGIQ